MAIGIWSCGSSRHSVSGKAEGLGEYGAVSTPTNQAEIIIIENTQLSPQAKAVLAEAQEWIGTPYRYGGKDKTGADCSGFVMEVFRSATGIVLPRNSADQCDFCKKINKEDLREGDLVFFSSNASKGKIAHVGIYIGGGAMIHASSSRGVVKSDVGSNYYTKHYLASGRILAADDIPAPVAPPASPPANAPDPAAAPAPEKTADTPSPEEIVKNAFRK